MTVSRNIHSVHNKYPALFFKSKHRVALPSHLLLTLTAQRTERQMATPSTLVTARLTAVVPRRAPPRVATPTPPVEPYKNNLNCSLNCSHFQTCSGCSHELNLDRPHVLQDVKKFFEENGVKDFSFHSGKLWEWRCRAKLAVRGTPNEPLVGLYQEGTHNVVDIPLCKAHHPRINAAVDLLKQGIAELNIRPYDEDSGFGELRYVQMAVTTYNTSLPLAERYLQGKVQVSLVWNSRDERSPNSGKLFELSNFLWKNAGPGSSMHLIHSVWANFQTTSTNVIFGHKWRHLEGEREFWEHLGGIDASIDPSSFGQANTQAFNSLLRKLQNYVPKGSSVLDLYSGAGVIGLSVAATRKCRSVKCVEINKESKASFEKSLSRLPKTLECAISWHNTDASLEPLHWLEGSDVVIVDPPRKGLHPSLVDALQKVSLSNKKVATKLESSLTRAKNEKRPWILRAREASVQVETGTNLDSDQIWPSTLIYISCGWDSFKEDCRNLVGKNGWHLEKAHAFNFFPGTQSIEVLAIFKRGPSVSLKKKKKKTKKNHS
ncbi:S-adenosyl-L-methionine-dependent methyltransferases superfamily protein [Rhynchospora pubera]|uniref:S-adenosyl-L-methionine-dependent methyltransferases superfamily protein n=1 Tax=Rhynchospora pubera TaxID=906938 RepID=A0AAV8G460_9POAL|nr:S-adenosyl-L-methionine-dependent methyltransferases superfamily protein [Rhynchospora pubera]